MAVRLVHGDRSYVREPGEELQSDLGVLEIPVDVSPGEEIETHLGHTFAVRSLRPPDFFEHFERSGAPMLPRDIGLILGETGVSVGDRVLDVGTGTGVLVAALASVGATVLTFERSPEAAAIAESNLEMTAVADRVEIRTGDALAAIPAEIEGEFDVLTLDTGDAPELLDQAAELVVPGGYVAAYSPFVEDARSIVSRARSSFEEVRAIETIQRELDVGKRGTRPSTLPVGHTGYLTFARKP